VSEGYHSKMTEHQGDETAWTDAADEVKVLAGEKPCCAAIFATGDFFHEITDDEEGGEASYAAAVDGEDSWHEEAAACQWEKWKGAACIASRVNYRAGEWSGSDGCDEGGEADGCT
jgi:hypothetical protein